MELKRLLLSTVVAGTFAGTGLAPAVAQESVPAVTQESVAAAEARGGGQGFRHHGEQRAFRLPSERVEARIAYLKTALKITDAQTPQWDAFADTLRRQARVSDERIKERRSAMERGAKRTPPTAIERMERRQKFLAAASERLNERLAAAKPLYAALSVEQQKIADELLAPRGRGGPRHPMRPHGRA